ncbi:MAG: hypothetical protein J5677_01040 [Bacteroidales bacterium]|nr:hypothetical protein [Bacteroidales bacterium]
MKNKKLIIGLIGLIGFLGNIQAQNGFNIPFSQFGIGIGDLPYTIPMVGRMGGVAYTTTGDNLINPFNPASYGAIGMESFVFDMGAIIQVTRLQNNQEKANDADGNIGHLMFGLPLTKWWKVAGGLLPYTTVEYESVSEGIYANNNSVIKNIYDGTGGTNMVFLGSAFNILDKGGRRLQIGFNIDLLFGRIQRALSYSFTGIDTTFFMDGRRFKETKIANLLFDFGVQYWEPLGDKYTLGVGLVYKPYRKMNIDDNILIYTYHASDQTLVDTVFPAAGESSTFTSTLEQAHTFGIGLSLARNNRWKVAADATFSGWAGMKYTEGLTPPVFGASTLDYGPYSRYALAFEKTGNMDASSYWGRISWSLGANIENGSIKLDINGDTKVVDSWGCGLGVTLPMRKGRSLLTLSAGYRNFGDKDLLQRECLTFGISVSSCERWFVKRKYN